MAKEALEIENGLNWFWGLPAATPPPGWLKYSECYEFEDSVSSRLL